MEPSQRILDQLMATIVSRRDAPSEKSYTSQLFSKGLEKIGEKVLEEAAEVVDAASELGEAGTNHCTYEAADLLYHLWVLLAAKKIGLDTVEAELARRFGISGLDEKAARGNSTPTE